MADPASSVWVQLYYEDQKEPDGRAIEILPVPRNVGALAKAVKTELELDAPLNKLYVYSAGTDPSFHRGQAIKSDQLVPVDTTLANPLIVVAPVPRQQLVQVKMDMLIKQIRRNLEAHQAMDRSSQQPDSQTPSLYRLDEGFVERDRYWVDRTRTTRIDPSSKVLYRPKVVEKLEDLLNKTFDASKGAKGIMVKGPQGVGKSYTLVNLVRKLMSSNKYLVTFIPDCERWDRATDLVQVILRSVGITLDPKEIGELGLNIPDDLEAFIGKIDAILKELGMKWVFVFDQINRIFARPAHTTVKDIGVLPFPFDMMKRLQKPGRIVSIISASANNEASYRDNHEGYEEFEHCPEFSLDEAKAVLENNNTQCPSKEEEWEKFFNEAKYFSGLVPLYLKNWQNNRNGYEGDTREAVKNSLVKLKTDLTEIEWDEVVTSATACLLQLRGDRNEIAFRMDRKFSYLSQEAGETDYCVKSLFPLAETEYRLFFWKDLVKYIEDHEEDLLKICMKNPKSKDVHGRFFESIVLARLQLRSITLDEAKEQLKEHDSVRKVLEGRTGSKLFEKHDFTQEATKFPTLLAIDVPKLWIPSSPVFPAVDAIIHVGSVVFAIQITVSKDHKCVKARMIQHAKHAKWHSNGITDIVLVYLCPDSATAEDLKNHITNGKDGGEQGPGDSFTVIQLFWSKENLVCLQNMQWPLGETKTPTAGKPAKMATKGPTQPVRRSQRNATQQNDDEDRNGKKRKASPKKGGNERKQRQLNIK